ncbi:MAG: C-terminal binding protein [Clostridia bacterium]|nr:C-terminal binding protein [Clostridia bacterium]
MTNITAIDKTGVFYTYETALFSKMEDVRFTITDADDEKSLIAALHDANVILFTAAKLTANVIKTLDNCKLIIRYGIGYDNVDTAAAKEKGIYVCNAPNYGVIDVAEHALMLMMATAKRVVRMHDMVRENRWSLDGIGSGSRLAGKNVGFVGFGKIARALCERTNALSMKPLVYDPYVSSETLAAFGATAATLDDLLANADIVTLHLPLMESTRHMFNMELFKKMKRSAVLINTSRGAIVKEADLIDALEAGYLAGVGLDVFENEVGGLDPRFLAVPNAVLTPHVAWNTAEATLAIHQEVTENVLRFMRGERPESIVNGL